MFTKEHLTIWFTVLLIVFFGFGFKSVYAQLPVEAGLGEDCDTETPCDPRFYCSAGVCVECESEAQCDERVGESCIEDVCTLPGGNSAGDLCAGGSNCKSGLKCGAAGVCEEISLPPGCFDTDGNGRITEEDCGTSENELCSLCEGALPLNCFDTDGNGKITEEDCGTSENELCSLCEGLPGRGGEWDWTGVDITIEDVANIIEGLACWLTRIATAIMVIFLVLAGLRFMNARGNPAAYQSAIKNFQHVLIGILVIMAVYVIIATVAYAVGRADFSLIPLVC